MLIIFQIVISVLLIVTIMLQTRGTQGGVVFGGTNETYRSKKGVEKFLFYGTIILAVLFASVSIFAILI